MKESYSNRQQKIYSDYSVYSTESLMEMFKSEKYLSEVHEIMNDILHERNAFSETIQESEVQIPELQPLIVQEGDNNSSPFRNHPLYGVHGWLKFFIVVNLYIAPPIFILQYIFAWAGVAMLASEYPGLILVVLIETIVGSILTYKGIVVAKDLRDIEKGAVKNAKTYLLLVLAWHIIDIPISFLSGLDSEKLIIDTAKQFILGIISFAIWYSYFNVSERVKITYPDWNA
jgi:hypothetical protein